MPSSTRKLTLRIHHVDQTAFQSSNAPATLGVPNIVEIWPDLVEVVTNLDESGRLVGLDQHRANFGPNRGNLGRSNEVWPVPGQFGSGLAETEPQLTAVGPILADSAPIWADSGQTSIEFG